MPIFCFSSSYFYTDEDDEEFFETPSRPAKKKQSSSSTSARRQHSPRRLDPCGSVDRKRACGCLVAAPSGQRTLATKLAWRPSTMMQDLLPAGTGLKRRDNYLQTLRYLTRVDERGKSPLLTD